MSPIYTHLLAGDFGISKVIEGTTAANGTVVSWLSCRDQLVIPGSEQDAQRISGWDAPVFCARDLRRQTIQFQD